MDFKKHIEVSNEINKFGKFNNVNLTHMEKDFAVSETLIGPDSVNVAGSMHGALIYLLCDNAASAAARSDGHQQFTQSSNLNFLRGVKIGRVYARAEVKHRGKTTCVVEVEAFDGDDKRIALGSFSFFNMGVPTSVKTD